MKILLRAKKMAMFVKKKPKVTFQGRRFHRFTAIFLCFLNDSLNYTAC